MERHHLNSWFVILAITIRLALGCLFVWSSLPKIFLPHNFLGDVYAYRLAGPVLGMIVTMILPWLELLTGICLLGGLFVGGALLTSMGMALMFIAAVSWALYHGLNISCGCFGSSAAVTIGYSTLIRITIILIGSGFAYTVELLAQRRTSTPLSDWWPWRRHRDMVLTDVSKPEGCAVSGLEPSI